MFGLLLLVGCVTAPPPKTVAPGSDRTFDVKQCQARGGNAGDLKLTGTATVIVAQVPCVTGSLLVRAGAGQNVYLPALEAIGGDLVVEEDAELTGLALPALVMVGGSVVIKPRPQLRSVGLPRLEVVGGDVSVGQEESLDAEPPPGVVSALAELGFPALRNVGGSILVRGHGQLVHLDLFALQEALGLELARNGALTKIELGPKTRLGWLKIAENAALVGLAELASVERVGPIQVLRNPKLAELALPALAVAGGLLVSDNHALTRVTLPALTQLEGALVIERHNALAELQLPRLLGVQGNILIGKNPALTTVALPALISAGGNLDLTSNFALANAEFPALTRIVGDLGLVSTGALVRFSASSLTKIEGDLVVQDGLALAGVHLPALVEVGGYVTVAQNPVLASVANWSALQRIGLKLYVRDNPRLPACELATLDARLAPRPMWGSELANNDEKAVCVSPPP